MRGRDGVAGDVIITSWRSCMGSFSRRSQQREWSTGSSGSSGEEERKALSLEAENKELRARFGAMGKNEGVQNGPGIFFTEDGDLEEVWGDCMEVEDQDERRRKLDEKRKKMQKEL